MKKVLLGLGIIASVLTVNANEKYISNGFSADIKSNGVINNLKYKDMAIANVIQISGEYELKENEEKHDRRFFQSWDYSKKAKFERDGDNLTVTVTSNLGNKNYKDALTYIVSAIFEPNKITVTNEVVHNIDLLSTYYIVFTNLKMSATLFGRGVKVLTSKDEEEFKILPKEYDKNFKMQGKKLDISLPDGIISIQPQEGTLGCYDCRAWKENNFAINIRPKSTWKPKAYVHEKGKVWKWGYTISFEENK